MYALYGMRHCCNLIAPLKFQLKEGSVVYVLQAHRPSFHHFIINHNFTSYGLVPWLSVVVWPAVAPVAACLLARWHACGLLFMPVTAVC